jgi:hypothetical protein
LLLNDFSFGIEQNPLFAHNLLDDHPNVLGEVFAIAFSVQILVLSPVTLDTRDRFNHNFCLGSKSGDHLLEKLNANAFTFLVVSVTSLNNLSAESFLCSRKNEDCFAGLEAILQQAPCDPAPHLGLQEADVALEAILQPIMHPTSVLVGAISPLDSASPVPNNCYFVEFDPQMPTPVVLDDCGVVVEHLLVLCLGSLRGHDHKERQLTLGG